LSGRFAVRRLGTEDLETARRLNELFADVFEDSGTYRSAPPTDSYVNDILSRESFIALAAESGSEIVGGLVAYVLPKLEQERSEIYIYDLAVAEDRRREGIASTLIAALQRIAAGNGAWVIYVQADYGDEPAISLYEKLGTREDVMHFDIAPAATR
jgi:aminoglycoside 3-N-acetyltransferase I